MSSAVVAGAPVAEPVGAGAADDDDDDDGAEVEPLVGAAAGENGSSDELPDGGVEVAGDGDEQDAAAKNDNNTDTNTDA